jgi:phosphotransferase system enzyme I (PtsI)
MAGEPLYIPVLLGYQLDSLSMNAMAVPRVKNLIRRSHVAECRDFLEQALSLGTAQEIGVLLQTLVLEKFPEEFRFFDPSALTPCLSRHAKREPPANNPRFH